MASRGTLERNKCLARRFPEEVAAGGMIDRIDEVCTVDVIERGPLGEPRGREEIMQQLDVVEQLGPCPEDNGALR